MFLTNSSFFVWVKWKKTAAWANLTAKYYSRTKQHTNKKTFRFMSIVLKQDEIICSTIQYFVI